MVAVKLGGDLEMLAIAAPSYLAEHGIPMTPRDLHRHRCINWRRPSDGSLYRWEFVEGTKEFEVSVEGPLIVNDGDLALAAALNGVGITYLFHSRVYDLIAQGKLARVLETWSPGFPGMYLYYPSRIQVPATLRAFIAFLRAEGVIRNSRAKKRVLPRGGLRS
jgi:DNA-binding transcriptional LysR family regulator